MADDIDDLLDEIEQKFFTSSNTTSCETNSPTFTAKIDGNFCHTISTCGVGEKATHDQLQGNVNKPRANELRETHSSGDSKDSSDGEDSDNIGDLIEDICSSSDEPLEPTKVPYIPSPQHPYASKPKKQCYKVYVGGSSELHGAATASHKLTCNKLRCTRCDFKVTIFDNLKWDPDVDYLFLRNNVPDYNRLRAKLLGSKGSCAYCCQCMCRTYRDLTPLDDPNLKWVCGKHLIDTSSE